jgi:hypothetical protein
MCMKRCTKMTTWFLAPPRAFLMEQNLKQAFLIRVLAKKSTSTAICAGRATF